MAAPGNYALDSVCLGLPILARRFDSEDRLCWGIISPDHEMKSVGIRYYILCAQRVPIRHILRMKYDVCQLSKIPSLNSKTPFYSPFYY